MGDASAGGRGGGYEPGGRGEVAGAGMEARRGRIRWVGPGLVREFAGASLAALSSFSEEDVA
jgi:hypothetical protein